MFVRRCRNGVELLHVVRNDEHVTVRSTVAIRMARSTRCRTCSGVIAVWTYSCAILEQRVEVDLLLIAAADRRSAGLADDGHDRLVIHLRVVEAVEQVDGARA